MYNFMTFLYKKQPVVPDRILHTPNSFFCSFFINIGSLTTKLPEAKLRLGHHRLREVRAGGHSIDPDIEQGSNNLNHRSHPRDQDQDSLGSMEIAILGMACAGKFF